jgi:hypothetical protein
MTDTRHQDFWDFLLEDERQTDILMRDWRRSDYRWTEYLKSLSPDSPERQEERSAFPQTTPSAPSISITPDMCFKALYEQIRRAH